MSARPQVPKIKYVLPQISLSDIPLQIPDPPEYFIGRQADIAQLKENLMPGEIVVLYGPAGIGKSALVRQTLYTLTNNNQAPLHFPQGIIYHDFYIQPKVDLALEKIARTLGNPISLLKKRHDAL